MTAQQKRYLVDLLERVGWTCAQAAVGVLVVAAADLPPGYAVLIATAAAAAKGLIAKRIGSPGTAATLPARDDTPLPSTG